MKNSTPDMYPLSTAQAPSMEMLDDLLLRSTKSAKDAVKQMVAYSNSTQEAIANEMKTTQYSVSRFINGNRGINVDDLEAFINSCGNLYLLQYLAHKYGKKLVDVDAKEALIKDLEYQLAMAKRAA
jgi:hypothetical protein